MKIRKGDTVEVISGDDKGVRGTVRRVYLGRDRVRRAALKGLRRLGPNHERDRVLVAGVNMIKKHQRRTGDAQSQAGIIERAAPVHLSNVALVCPHCQRPTRVGYQILPTGSRVRVCRRCEQAVE